MADELDQRSGDDVTTEDTEDEEVTETDVEGGEDSGDGEEEEKVSKADFDKLKARMIAADKAKSAAEARIREQEQAKLGDLDKAKAQVEELTQRAAKAEEKLKNTQIENAFHRLNKFEFHDVADAIAALDLSGVDIDDDGSVTGMEAAIKDVVKRKPHFVKSQKEKGDSTGQLAANGAVNGQRKGDEKVNAANRAALARRFPALNR